VTDPVFQKQKGGVLQGSAFLFPQMGKGSPQKGKDLSEFPSFLLIFRTLRLGMSYAQGTRLATMASENQPNRGGNKR
jgi:hypothetical protein